MTRMSESKRRSLAAIGDPPREPAASPVAPTRSVGIARRRVASAVDTLQSRIRSDRAGASRVIPAQAGIQVGDLSVSALLNWAPAYAGATMEASALLNWAPAYAGATIEASALPDRAPTCAGAATIVNRLVSALPFVAT